MYPAACRVDDGPPIIWPMRMAKGNPGTNTRTEGKTSIRSTMTPVIGKKGAGRKSASRLKARPMTGR